MAINLEIWIPLCWKIFLIISLIYNEKQHKKVLSSSNQIIIFKIRIGTGQVYPIHHESYFCEQIGHKR